ncbi:MAG: 23S rRNA (uracil(1939)-C(5))-methyltransferase RlmD [Sedimentibacter sp.]
MIEEGQITEVEIIDLNNLGQGVAKIDNFVIFIEGTIEGDLAEIKITEKKKNFAVGKLLKIIKDSEKRIKPNCVHYEQCGGCQLMHMDYLEQLKYKKNRVINELKRADIILDNADIYDTIGMDSSFRYRNKTAFSVTKKNNEIYIGPYEQRTYNIVDINGCSIQSKEADDAVILFKDLIIKYKIDAYDKKTGKGTIRNIVIRNNRKNELMFIIVATTENFSNRDALIKELAFNNKNIKTIILNINNKNTNLVMGRKNITLYGEGTINDTIDDLSFTISPETFFQINPIQTEKLYQKVIEYAHINNNQVCFDIYCGIGTISLMAAKHAKKVYGVEIVEQSIINARENAVRNKISNAEFYSGKAEEIVPKLYKQGIKGDVVIVDPPRKGCEKEVIDTIISMTPEKVVYVSCNPSTLARDIKLLEAGGYTLKKVQPIDMFPWTVHCESVVELRRIEKKNR